MFFNFCHVSISESYLACLPTGKPEGSINDWHQHPWQPLIQHHERWNILQSSWIKRKQTLIFLDRMEMAEPIKGKKKTQSADWDSAPHAPMCTLVHTSSWNVPFTAWELSASRHEWDAIYKRNPKTWYKPKLKRALFYKMTEYSPKVKKIQFIERKPGNRHTVSSFFSCLDAYKHMVNWLILPGRCWARRYEVSA